MAQNTKNLRQRNANKNSAAPKQASTKQENPLNPKSTHFEFMGPYIGPLGLIFVLPFFVWCYAFFNNSKGWPHIDENISVDYIIHAVKSSWNINVFLTYCAYYAMLVVFYYVLPGERKEGTVLRNGKTLRYPMNGLFSMLLTIAIAIGIHIFKPYGYDLTWICDHMVELVSEHRISALHVFPHSYPYFRRSFPPLSSPLSWLSTCTFLPLRMVLFWPLVVTLEFRSMISSSAVN